MSDEKREPGNGKSDHLYFEIDRSSLESWTKPTLKGHTWVQKGPYLVCRSCKLEHGTYIGTGKLFLGTDKEGLPILKKIEFR